MLSHREAPAPAVASVAPSDAESAKDMEVLRFVHSGKSLSARERAAAVQILQDDIRTMGATADAAHLPMLTKLLSSDVPEIRSAAADAIGMISPTAAETAALAKLAEDLSAPVAAAARRALSASSDPAAREIAAKTAASK
jgi:HEAT repeat protein